MNTREIRRSFLHDKLIPLILSPSPPKAVNLRDEFRKHIEDQGQGRLRSAELAEEHLKPLCEFVENHLCDWDAQGIPRPLAQADGGNVFLVWLHDRFLYYSGTETRIDRNFCAIYRYLQSLDGTQFLVACSMWLKCIGFRRIYISDSSGDSGVDLLGIAEDGGLRSLIVAIQAKTSRNPIGKGVILNEWAKYKLLPRSERYSAYRRALGVESLIDGNSWNYLVLANQPFSWTAREVSRELGVLIRSVHQIAFLLAAHYSKSEIALEVDRLSPNLAADLTVNVYNTLSI